MKFSKNILEFYVQNAEYCMSDKTGNQLIVNINYSGNSYNLIIVKKLGELNGIQNEARCIAENLLKRKSGVNIVNR